MTPTLPTHRLYKGRAVDESVRHDVKTGGERGDSARNHKLFNSKLLLVTIWIPESLDSFLTKIKNNGAFQIDPGNVFSSVLMPSCWRLRRIFYCYCSFIHLLFFIFLPKQCHNLHPSLSYRPACCIKDGKLFLTTLSKGSNFNLLSQREGVKLCPVLKQSR